MHKCAKADDAALASLQADVDGAKSEELIAPKNIMNLGRGDGYALSQDQLRAFK